MSPLQDASGEVPHEQTAPQNPDVQDAVHASLDVSQQAQPSSAQHTGVSEGSAFADPDFQDAVSRALDSGVAEPADSQAPHQVLRFARLYKAHGFVAINVCQQIYTDALIIYALDKRVHTDDRNLIFSACMW